MTRAHLANTPPRLHRLRACPTNAMRVRLAQQDRHPQKQQHVPVVPKVNIKMTPLKQAARTAEQASTIARLDKPLIPRAKIVVQGDTKIRRVNRFV